MIHALDEAPERFHCFGVALVGALLALVSFGALRFDLAALRFHLRFDLMALRFHLCFDLMALRFYLRFDLAVLRFRLRGTLLVHLAHEMDADGDDEDLSGSYKTPQYQAGCLELRHGASPLPGCPGAVLSITASMPLTAARKVSPC